MSGPKSGENESSVDRIILAAEEEFARHGFDAVNMRQIADAAGVSTKLVYHYFGRKETLYFEALVHMARVFFERFEHPAFDSADPIGTIREFAMRYAEFYQGHPETGRLILDQVIHGGQQIRRISPLEKRRTEVIEPLRKALEQGVAQGIIRAGVTAEGLFYHMLLVTIGYTSMIPLLGPLHLDIEELKTDEDRRRVIADAVVGFVRSPLN